MLNRARIDERKEIPAEALPEFNRNIVGVIEMIAEYQAPDGAGG